MCSTVDAGCAADDSTLDRGLETSRRASAEGVLGSGAAAEPTRDSGLLTSARPSKDDVCKIDFSLDELKKYTGGGFFNAI